MKVVQYFEKDENLKPYSTPIAGRLQRAFDKERELLGHHTSLVDVAIGYLYFGLHRKGKNWNLREWVPNATAIYLLGDFSEWKCKDEFKLEHTNDGVWCIEISGELLKHQDLYKLHVCWEGGSGDRIPAWARRVVQDIHTYVFNAQVWSPEKPYKWKHDPPKTGKNFNPLIYEAHVGMATEEYRVGTYDNFRKNVLPHIKKLGYNTIPVSYTHLTLPTNREV